MIIKSHIKYDNYTLMVFLAATAMLALFSLMADLTLNVDILIEILGLDQTGNKNKNKSKSEKLLKRPFKFPQWIKIESTEAVQLLLW